MNEEEMIVKNIPLIYYTLHKMNIYGSFEDYYESAAIGLIRGVRKYNPNAGYTESTYLVKCIRNQVGRQIRIEKALKRNGETVSIYSKINNEDGLMLVDTLQSDINIEEDLIRKEMYEYLYEEIENLTENEQFCLNHFFGLKSYKKLKQYEICEKLQLSQTQVSRIIKKAIKKLRLKLSKKYTF